MLEQKLEDAFNELAIPRKQQDSLKIYLELIRRRDEETWEHSIRTGLKGIEVANYIHIVHPKVLFYAGLLHDVGKALTNPKSLKKNKGFNKSDARELKRHIEDSYRLIMGDYKFSAEIVYFHHEYKEKGTLKKLPNLGISFSKGSEVNIRYYARILALIDFYDSVTYRENDKFSPSNPRLPTKEETKQILLEHNPDQIHFINELYKDGIF